MQHTKSKIHSMHSESGHVICLTEKSTCFSRELCDAWVLFFVFELRVCVIWLDNSIHFWKSYWLICVHCFLCVWLWIRRSECRSGGNCEWMMCAMIHARNMKSLKRLQLFCDETKRLTVMPRCSRWVIRNFCVQKCVQAAAAVADAFGARDRIWSPGRAFFPDIYHRWMIAVVLYNNQICCMSWMRIFCALPVVSTNRKRCSRTKYREQLACVRRSA